MKIHDYELMNEIYMDLKNYLTSTNLDISDIMEIIRDLDEDMSIEHITRKVQETCYVDKYSRKYHNDAELSDAEWDFNELI
jgi:Na+/phosphate symporter